MTDKALAIYVIGSLSGPVKIGVSSDPSRRLKAVQAGNHGTVTLIYEQSVPSALAASIVSKAHRLLREHRTDGGWFRLKSDIAIKAVEQAIAARGGDAGAGRHVGRKRVIEDKVMARFPANTFDRMDAVLAEKEKRSEFIREAVEKELTRRERAKAKRAREEERGGD